MAASAESTIPAMVMYIKSCSRSTPPVQLRILEEYVTAEWYVYVEHFCDHLLIVRMDISDQEQRPPAAEKPPTYVDASTGSNPAAGSNQAGTGSSSSSSLGFQGKNKRRTGWKDAAARGGCNRPRNYNP